MNKKDIAIMDICNVFTQNSKVKKSYIEGILESAGYAQESEVKRETISRNRRRKLEPFIKGGFIKDVGDYYIPTEKFQKIKPELKKLLNNEFNDSKCLLDRMDEMYNSNNRDDRDNMMGFVTTNRFDYYLPTIHNYFGDKINEDLKLFVKLVSEIFNDEVEMEIGR
jgi:hypothetical protein